MGRLQNFLIGNDEGSAEVKPLKPIWKCLVSEFLGTVMLIFIGCGCGLKLSEESKDDRPLPGIALCWAFTIATLAQTFGTYSADLNPAITLAALTTRKITVLKAVLFIPVQCAGCICGAFLLKAVLPYDIIGTFSVTMIGDGVPVLGGLFIEIIITGFLVFVIFAANDPERNDLRGSMALSIGFCIGGIILFAAPFTGASMNPARTLGPSVVANHWDHHWVYWVGPIVGAQVGGNLYHYLFRVRWPEGRPKPSSI